MNAPVALPACGPACGPAPDAAPTTRADGWTPDRQHGFLAALAEGHTVEAACRIVGLSVASAYAFRRRAGGAAFALGWRAACLLARDKLADTLMSRALDGQVETITRADGATVTRHRYDNRLAAAMLARLDRLADSAPTFGDAGQEAARLAAGDWERFAGLIAEGGAGAEAALFVAARAERDEDAPDPQLPQLRSRDAGDADEDEEELDDEEDEIDADDTPVWFDPGVDQYVTFFPPPPGFDGQEIGRYGDEDYKRTLSYPEFAVYRDRGFARAKAMRAEETTERNAFFGFAPDGAAPG